MNEIKQFILYIKYIFLQVEQFSYDVNSSMATDYTLRNRTRDLWEQIEHLHLTYLETDESLRKIDERKRLEGKIGKSV